MKRLLYIFAMLLLVASCYGVGNENLVELEPIVFGDLPTTVNVPLGQKLVLSGLQISSNLPIEYQWAYGKQKNKGESWEMESMEIISNTATVDYVFPKIGTYVLRLRVDNGESIEYRYFTLNVNSGLDEGLLILNTAESGESSLTFIKRRSDEEVASGAQEIWDDVFSFMNGGARIERGTSMFMSAFASGGISYNHLIVSTDDAHGNVYDINPKDISLVSAVPMRDEFGTWCKDFSGKQTASTGSYTFLLGGDGHVYRYDLFTPFITERTDLYSAAGAVDRCHNIMYTTTQTYVKAGFFTEKMICQPDNSGTSNLRPLPDGWKLVNFYGDRDANRTYTLMQSETNPSSFCIKYTTASLSVWKDVSEFTATGVNMDINSIFCSSLNSNDVYYSYNNAVYRWGMTTKPAENPTFTLPAGEQICDIATNFMPIDDGTAETLLYVATYNPSRSGKKGSVYIYEIATDTLYKVYEGVCDEPVRLLYKYRVS